MSFSNVLKTKEIFSSNSNANLSIFIISVLLSIPAILLAENILFAIPVISVIILCFVFGERFIITIIIISLFTLIGELSGTLRSVIHLVDFVLLGILFLKRFGLNTALYPSIPKSLAYFLLLYYSALIISSIMSNYPFSGVGIIAKQTAFFIIAYVFYSLIQNEDDIKNYFTAIIVVACIFVTVSFIFFINSGFDLIALISKDRTRVSAITGNIEALTNFYIVIIPLLIGYLLLNKKLSSKMIAGLVLFYFFIGLTLAMSRSAIMGIIVSMAIIFFILRRNRFYQFTISLIVLFLIFFLYKPFNETMNLFLRIEEGMSARDYLWTMSMNIIRDYPVFGIGPGAYKYVMFSYYPFMLHDFWGQVFVYIAEVSEGVNLAHNLYLVFFVDMGILGLATVLMLPLIYFRIGIKTIKKYKKAAVEKYYFIVALFAAGTSIIFRNIFNSIGLLYIGGIHTDLPFWLIFISLIYFYRSPVLINTVVKT